MGELVTERMGEIDREVNTTDQDVEFALGEG